MSKVSQEVAEAEFERFCTMLDAYSTAAMYSSAEDLEAFNSAKAQFVRAVMAGSLVVDDEGVPVYTPTTPGWEHGPIRFPEPTVGQQRKLDREKQDAGVSRTILLISTVTGLAPSNIDKLMQRDKRVCDAVILGFFG